MRSTDKRKNVHKNVNSTDILKRKNVGNTDKRKKKKNAKNADRLKTKNPLHTNVRSTDKKRE